MSEEMEFNRLTDDKNDDGFGSTDPTTTATTSASTARVEEMPDESGMKLLQDLTSKQALD